MSCTSDPKHSAQKCFCNRKWHYKVMHASLGREISRNQAIFFSPQTIPISPLLKLAINKKNMDPGETSVDTRSPNIFAPTCCGAFLPQQGTRHKACHASCLRQGLLHITQLGSTGTSRKQQASSADKVSQDRCPEWTKTRIIKCLLEVPVALPLLLRKPQ